MKMTPLSTWRKFVGATFAGALVMATGLPTANAICGDGTLEPLDGEECDDGNLIDDDGCDSACIVENPAGCADGVREGFSDQATYPYIASCAGAWDIPGIRNTSNNRCDAHGDDNPGQTDCTASDLCAVGWHICGSSDDVVASAPNITTAAECNTAAVDASPTAYFTSQMSGPGFGQCSTNPADHNDLFGCGDEGLPAGAGCGVLGRFTKRSVRCSQRRLVLSQQRQ